MHGKPVDGIEPLVRSYREFGSMGKIHSFDIIDLAVYEFDVVSICHMRFEVDCEIESGRIREEGLEAYVIDTYGAAPRVVWRTQIATNANDA